MSERSKDAIYDRIVFGDIYTDVRVEELYQAFKARLLEEMRQEGLAIPSSENA